MTTTIRPCPTWRRGVLCAAVLTCALPGLAWVQKYPDKPIRLVVPFAAGGGTDILARDVAPRLGDALGQSVVVDNRGGAGGNIGSDLVAKAPADGYTLLFGSNTLSINASLYRNLPFDPVRSFAPVGMVATAPMVLVTAADGPLTSVRALVAEAKARPGTMNWSTPGNGTPHHLAEELFNKMTGANLTHVQYKGGGPAINDLLGRHTQASVLTLASVKSFIDAGRLRAIAVATPHRSALLPDVPTVAEAGVPGYKAELWYGLFAPAGTPASVVDRLNQALAKVLTDPQVAKRFRDQGFEARSGTPDELRELLADDLARSGKLIRDAGIQAD
ncbi:tripartite tricarboxylate transporter substrate binding protein [uncultured Xylophilus sp.]|uniref:Bug family tripartite tricarboxylate transporter substrate binding protein n=1 Tax=uncultured Xylophilus sp. TaxID=296832 RepID=UPI0025E8E9C4|nr:tripartite tricarboxylate transporter substrate binding protein [uncultured Xylophilus sp.]